jgi:hypothetical protein
MKNTIRPFHLGSNVMVEIVNGTLRQLKADTLETIKEIPVSSLTDQQIAALENSRKKCSDAAIAQGFQKAGYVNEQ